MSDSSPVIESFVEAQKGKAAAYEHNGQPISREDFYAIACDPRRSVAVEACAGAGKTWMLVSRILRALLDGAKPHEILAITFTKKAAGEMRQRLQEWLQEFSQAPRERLVQELIARGISPSDAQAKQERLKGLYRQVLEGGRPVQIRTFHSWFAALLGTAPVALLKEQGLPTNFELLEDDAEAIREVWRPFMRRVAADDGNLRADFEALVRRYGRSQTIKALENGLKKRIEFEMADANGVVASSVPSFKELFPGLACSPIEHPLQAMDHPEFAPRWLAWAKALGLEANKTPQKAAAGIVAALEASEHSDRLALLRKSLFVATEDRLSVNLQKFAAAQQAEPELQVLLAAARQHDAYEHHQRLSNLMRYLALEFAAVKAKNGWIDMSDVERMALLMLSDPVLGGWVQERLDARVSHLLIDEFQDTSPLQWQAIHAWLDAYAGVGGGSAPSVFIVGDPKQSIYRFRRAEPQVFIAAQRFVRQGLGGDMLSCDHTRRNAQGVIAAVNVVMGDAQTEREVEGFRQHTTESSKMGVVERLPFVVKGPSDVEQDEAGHWRDSLTQARHEAETTMRMRESEQAARWVVSKIESGVAPSEIMVMARKRDRLAHMQDALRALHVPCVMPEKLDLYSAAEVQDVVALLDVLISTTHDLSLARALKSPLFNLSDEALTQIALHCRNAPLRTSWFDAIQAMGKIDGVSEDVAAVLSYYRSLVEGLPVHDALHTIYEHGDVLARFAAAAPAQQRQSVLANLRALLASSLQHDGGRFVTAYDFVRSIRKGGVKAPGRVDQQAVRLLTVHGAKGLEAECVLLLDTAPMAQKSENMSVLVDWPGEEKSPKSFIFMASESSPPPSAVQAMETEKAARQREEINSLYVALTRAKTCLALSAVETRGAASRNWWIRLQSVLSDARGLDAADGAGVQVSAQQSMQRVQQHLVLPALPAVDAPVSNSSNLSASVALSAADQGSSVASRTGEAMHRLLEQLTSPARANAIKDSGWPKQRVASLAREFDIPSAAAEKAADMALRILKGEGAWAWDASEAVQAINEASLQYNGQSMRIDRLVERTGEAAGWWILDYKSAANPQQQESLLAQMALYKDAVRAQYGDVPVHAAFLTGEGRLLTV